MELLTKLERIILQKLKDIPHLPFIVRKWLGTNLWWIAMAGAILIGLSILVLFINIAWYDTFNPFAVPQYAAWQKLTGTITIIFLIVQALLLVAAIKPLQLKQKKGWVLVYFSLLVSAVHVVVAAIMTLDVLDLIARILFGAIWLALSGYVLFEIHSQFAHTEKSQGTKAKK